MPARFPVSLPVGGVMAVALLVSGGCSFDSSAPVIAALDGGTVDAGGDIDAANSAAFGFSEDFERWAVPQAGLATGFNQANIALGTSRNWLVMDIDDDQVPELLQTSDPFFAKTFSDATSAYWKVFRRATGNGFVTDPELYRLPDIQTANNGIFSINGPNWTFTDLDGDGIPELVVFTDPSTSELWTDGTTSSWQVHKSTGLAFGAPSQWPVPDLGANTLKSKAQCLASVGCWQLLDLNSDARLDIIHSADAVAPLAAWDATTAPAWHVYLNDGQSFASTFLNWLLPSPINAEGFFRATQPSFWTTLDVDGDSSLELVHTRDLPNAVGPFYRGTQPIWKVFEIDGSGFNSNFQDWNVPIGSVPFDADGRAAGNLQWGTIDIDGDGIADLVHTANTASPTPSAWGAPTSDQWKVYLGTGSGFAPTAVSWPLPDSGLNDGFYGLTVAETNRRWSTIDIDGDGQVELVQTADPATDAVWTDEAGPYWRVYRRASN